MRLLCPNIAWCGDTAARLFTVVTRSGVAAVSPWSESNSLSCAALDQGGGGVLFTICVSVCLLRLRHVTSRDTEQRNMI